MHACSVSPVHYFIGEASAELDDSTDEFGNEEVHAHGYGADGVEAGVGGPSEDGAGGGAVVVAGIGGSRAVRAMFHRARCRC